MTEKTLGQTDRQTREAHTWKQMDRVEDGRICCLYLADRNHSRRQQIDNQPCCRQCFGILRFPAVLYVFLRFSVGAQAKEKVGAWKGVRGALIIRADDGGGLSRRLLHRIYLLL